MQKKGKNLVTKRAKALPFSFAFPLCRSPLPSSFVFLLRLSPVAFSLAFFLCLPLSCLVLLLGFLLGFLLCFSPLPFSFAFLFRLAALAFSFAFLLCLSPLFSARGICLQQTVCATVRAERDALKVAPANPSPRTPFESETRKKAPRFCPRAICITFRTLATLYAFATDSRGGGGFNSGTNGLAMVLRGVLWSDFYS